MKKSLLYIVFIAFSGFAQQPAAVHSKDGITVKTYDYANFDSALHIKNDSIYVVNFWATWCAPCVKELPHFEKLNAQYKGQKVKVILVSLDMNKQVETSLMPFIKKKKLQSQVVHLHDPDADAWISKVDPTWSGAIPATVIYNKDKRKFYEQSFTYEQLETEVKQFIN
jgi:thiol-disulfide isomerase/thioredoxin